MDAGVYGAPVTTRSLQLSVSLLSTLALCLSACGDDSGASASGDAGSSADSSEASTDGASSVGSASDGAGTTEAPPAWVPAAGISITSVELNQGTGQDIARGGDWVEPAGRTSFVVQERDAVVRVHFTVPDDWSPREVEARLHLSYLDGRDETLTQALLVEASSEPASLDSTFTFTLRAEDGQAVPGAKFQVELYEPTGAGQGEPAVWRTPDDGPSWVGFEADPAQLKIMIVPIHYKGDGSDIVAEVTDEDLARIEDAFFETNPVQEVLLELHSPLVFAESLGGDIFSGLSPLLTAVAQLRAAERPADNVYYHALLDQGCQFTGCTEGGGLLGQAINIPGPSMGEANLRVASSMYYKPDGEITGLSLETMVHEHGHTQGLMHVFCPSGGSFGNDPSFPDPEGKIGAWGLGLRSRQLHEPGVEFDYMSYCRPAWLGPWTWNKTYERARTLTSWDLGATEPGARYPVLVGAYHEGGGSEWWTMDMALDDGAGGAGERVEFLIDGAWVSRPAVVRELSERDGYWILSPLPGPASAIERIRHVGGAGAREVDVGGVKLLHRADDFAGE